MWLFTIYGFFSISVEGKWVYVRARCKRHLQTLQGRFPGMLQGEIISLQGRDYDWRLRVRKATWVDVMWALANEQTWDNFKEQTTKQNSGDPEYIDALHDVWERMHRLQIPRQKQLWKAALAKPRVTRAISRAVPGVDVGRYED